MGRFTPGRINEKLGKSETTGNDIVYRTFGLISSCVNQPFNFQTLQHFNLPTTYRNFA
jgi:hypothetical protein